MARPVHGAIGRDPPDPLNPYTLAPDIGIGMHAAGEIRTPDPLVRSQALSIR